MSAADSSRINPNVQLKGTVSRDFLHLFFQQTASFGPIIDPLEQSCVLAIIRKCSTEPQIGSGKAVLSREKKFKSKFW